MHPLAAMAPVEEQDERMIDYYCTVKLFDGDKTVIDLDALVSATYQSRKFIELECTTMACSNSNPLISSVLPTPLAGIILPAWRRVFCTLHAASLTVVPGSV